MTLLGWNSDSQLDQVYVALDLETTGLSAENDAIIEVGAVKFRGDQQIDTFQALVNPFRQLPDFVTSLTGITQNELEKAPPFSSVVDDLQSFLGDVPFVGHNVAFDLAFLEKNGVSVTAPVYDTKQLASVLFPKARDTSLVGLCFGLKLLHGRPHRALEDAAATARLLVALIERACNVLDPALAAEVHRLALQSGWRMQSLFETIEAESRRRATDATTLLASALDTKNLSTRLETLGQLEENGLNIQVDEEEVASLFAPDGPLARTFPDYEARPQQIEFALQVTRVLNNGGELLIEGGTGIGKSLAYLIPSLLLALRNNTRVVVSTNTINLQQQLTTKDIPRLNSALEGYPGIDTSDARVALLKGRSNYLCLQRMQHLLSNDAITPDEARTASKVLVWLRDTETGDRAELGPDVPSWNTLCAAGSYQCFAKPCFLRTARQRAEAAQLLVVNHALLLSDIARGGTLLPGYDHLIIDEAHHLEDEATRQFGFRISQSAVEELLESVGGPRGIAVQSRSAGFAAGMPEQHRRNLEDLVQRLLIDVGEARERSNDLFQLLSAFITDNVSGYEQRFLQVSIGPLERAQQNWTNLIVSWERLDGTLVEIGRILEDITLLLGDTSLDRTGYKDALLMDVSDHLQSLETLRQSLITFFPKAERETVYWLALEGQQSVITLNAAPLDVGPMLDRGLFSQKNSVVLTSATMSIQDSFTHIRERLGLDNAEECLLGSPFDYPNSVLLSLPQDMPQPTDAGYVDALSQSLLELGEALDGRVMALFTSYASLRTVRQALAAPLEAKGVTVLAQGIDGSPHHLVGRFSDYSRAVLLGTASFWEGVDLPDGLLKALVIVRLPFNVPTDPVFAARSQSFDNPFTEYAVPQAVLRFRQGFGRLIRRQEDKGAVVLLDRRATARAYGQAFLSSIPPCTVVRGPLRDVPNSVLRWIEE